MVHVGYAPPPSRVRDASPYDVELGFERNGTYTEEGDVTALRRITRIAEEDAAEDTQRTPVVVVTTVVEEEERRASPCTTTRARGPGTGTADRDDPRDPDLDDDQVCVICCEGWVGEISEEGGGTDVCILACGHAVFHGTCMSKWLFSTDVTRPARCPICRCVIDATAMGAPDVTAQELDDMGITVMT